MESLYAYTAGLFDGEGHITLNKCNGYGGALRIGITNTDINSLIAIRQEWGNIGSISVRKNKKAEWKSRADWRISGEPARNFLMKLLPYLRIKRARAELVLGVKFASTGQNYSSEDKVAIAMAVAKLAELNKRGVSCQS